MYAKFGLPTEHSKCFPKKENNSSTTINDQYKIILIIKLNIIMIY